MDKFMEDMINEVYGEGSVFEQMSLPRPCDQCGIDTEADELTDGLCLHCNEELYLEE